MILKLAQNLGRNYFGLFLGFSWLQYILGHAGLSRQNTEPFQAFLKKMLSQSGLFFRMTQYGPEFWQKLFWAILGLFLAAIYSGLLWALKKLLYHSGNAKLIWAKLNCGRNRLGSFMGFFWATYFPGHLDSWAFYRQNN